MAHGPRPGPGRRDGASAPTLEDVARRAGVSTATVSRCLNAPERVIEATRERVLEAVAALGYAPNFGARALAARRTNTIGAIIPTMENAIFARGLQAFQEELGAHGFTMLVASSSYRPDLEEAQIRALIARGADGLLLIGHDRPAQVYDFLDQRGVPYLVAWVHDPARNRLSIGFDNRAAMQGLAARVLALGHRRIGLISAPQADNDRARERVHGVLAAVVAEGLDPASVRIVEAPYSIENGGAAFRALMSGPHPPTAVLCGNDVLAAGALAMAREMALRVPQDVSITGFDDLEIARIVAPPLTTVHVPHRAMGAEAARMLVALVTGKGTPATVRLETEIVMRGTLGPAPAEAHPV
jgi:LacI family transcriptional regulator